jgi:hypothetical protein
MSRLRAWRNCLSQLVQGGREYARKESIRGGGRGTDLANSISIMQGNPHNYV